MVVPCFFFFSREKIFTWHTKRLASNQIAYYACWQRAHSINIYFWGGGSDQRYRPNIYSWDRLRHIPVVTLIIHFLLLLKLHFWQIIPQMQKQNANLFLLTSLTRCSDTEENKYEARSLFFKKETTKRMTQVPNAHFDLNWLLACHIIKIQTSFI